MAARTDLIGRNVSFTIAPVTISNVGAVTVGTALAMTGKADKASQRSIRENERIEALDATIANHVPILDDWVFTLSGIKRTQGTNANPVEIVFFATSFAQIVMVTPLTTFTYQGLLSEQSWDVVRGKNTDDVTLIPIDTGAANPLIAAT